MSPEETKLIACDKCGATTQLQTGVCVSCLLGEGLEAGEEVSRAVFESAIAEVNVPDKQWRLGDYEILDEIGRGGMGVIYLARQRHPQRIVAVKRVLDYHVDSRETLRRFRREADAAASLDHPNILPIYEVSESEDGLPFFSMKFATGGTLRTVGPALRAEPRKCVQLMAKVARAVEYAHGQGILHRDLKPGNILLDGRGEPLVSDFGLAKFIDANKDLTKSLTTFGTPGYTAPEQAEGRTADLTPAADVYSLGAILFELLAGRPPFVGDNALAVIRQALETPVPKLRSLIPGFDRDLETVCARCLERERQARYQSASDLADDLECWLEGKPIKARRALPPTRIWRWSRRNRKLAGIAVACVVLGLAVIWLAHSRWKAAQTIAQMKVSAVPGQKLTRNPKAYDLFVKGEYARERAWTSNVNGALKPAIAYFREAVALDPQFALAFAQLAAAQLTDYYFGLIDRNARRMPELLAMAKENIDRALRLDPDLAAAHSALGNWYLWGKSDYDAALAEFKRALAIDPQFSDASLGITGIALRRGRPDAAIACASRAIEFDPRNPRLLRSLGIGYMFRKDYARAVESYSRAVALDPTNQIDAANLCEAIILEKGDIRAANQVLDALPPELQENPVIANRRIYLLMLGREFAAAKKLVENLPPESWPTEWRRPQLLGEIELALGRTQLARESFHKAHVLLTAAAGKEPAEPRVHADLAVVDAQLGLANEALREADRAIDLQPVEKDAFRGPEWLENRARVNAGLGRIDEAIKLIEEGLAMPIQVFSAWQLKLEPWWDPLRGDPRFDEIVASLAAKETSTVAPEKSIAVLPFENLSSDKENAYFADGIQEEILTRLAKIADLKVISRTSTQHYKGTPKNVPEIARQLGVAHILEGSVQNSGNSVRINVQLIKAANDSHLWADSFDRKLTDIFSVESEVAKAIADQLRAKLTGQEEQVVAAKPTDNIEAYDAYLRGLAYSLKAFNTPANPLGAQKYLREAVRLDPKFALSWALLSYVDAVGYITATLQPTIALREEARQAAETALTLQPKLGEAILATGQYHYACLKDYDTAVDYFEQARQFLPNNSRIPESLAYVTRRQGEWDRSESYFNEAERLNPRDVGLLTQHALSYINLRRFSEALRKLDQVLNITPDDVDTISYKAAIAQAKGDLPRASVLLAPLHPAGDDPQALETQVYQAILERRPAPVIPRLKEILAKPDPSLGFFNGELRFWLGWAQEVTGNHGAAQESWRQARSELEPFLKEQPKNYLLVADLALTNMGVGDKAAAFALTEQAMAGLPIEKDAMDGPIPLEILARVAAQMGEPNRAIAALQKLLSIPYEAPFAKNVPPLTPAVLRLDPMFDPLRGDSRFQELCKDKQL